MMNIFHHFTYMAKFFSSTTNSSVHSSSPNFHAKISNHSPGPLHSSLSDKDLYHLCQLYGGNAKTWLRKFAGLLPEVYKRSLHLRRNCGSIQEFAKKLSGMNERTTDKILSLHRRLANMPHLLALFESGEQGWSKLEKVAFIATLETEKDLAEKVKGLPKAALEIYIQSQREKLTNTNPEIFTPGSQARNNLQISQGAPNQEGGAFSAASRDVQSQSFSIASANPNDLTPHAPIISQDLPRYTETFTTFSFPISAHSRQKLNLLKSTLEKEHRKTLTWNQVIELCPTIESFETKSFSNPQIKICPSCALKKITTNATRHVPIAIRRLILATHGQICVFPNCSNAYNDFHHLSPYVICKKHDPKNIYPVCKIHHTLFHAGLITNSEKPPAHWTIRNHPIQNSIDKKTMKFKINFLNEY